MKLINKFSSLWIFQRTFFTDNLAVVLSKLFIPPLWQAPQAEPPLTESRCQQAAEARSRRSCRAASWRSWPASPPCPACLAWSCLRQKHKISKTHNIKNTKSHRTKKVQEASSQLLVPIKSTRKMMCVIRRCFSWWREIFRKASWCWGERVATAWIPDITAAQRLYFVCFLPTSRSRWLAGWGSYEGFNNISPNIKASENHQKCKIENRGIRLWRKPAGFTLHQSTRGKSTGRCFEFFSCSTSSSSLSHPNLY